MELQALGHLVFIDPRRHPCIACGNADGFPDEQPLAVHGGQVPAQRCTAMGAVRHLDERRAGRRQVLVDKGAVQDTKGCFGFGEVLEQPFLALGRA